MINHFTITIHDDNGVKQFKLHQFVKKAIIYALVFIALIVFIGIATILYLNNNVSDIEKNISEVQTAYNKLQEKNKALSKSIKENQVKIEVDELPKVKAPKLFMIQLFQNLNLLSNIENKITLDHFRENVAKFIPSMN